MATKIAGICFTNLGASTPMNTSAIIVEL